MSSRLLSGVRVLAILGFTLAAAGLLQGHCGSAFAATTTHPVGVSPFYVTSGDFNLDGNLDLVSSNFSSNTVSVLMGNGLGGFAPQVSYGTGPGPFHVEVFDFDRDGWQDLVVGNFGGNTLSLLINNRNGTFAPAYSLTVGASPFGIAIADLNGDLRPDLVVANQDDSNVQVFRGNGFGTFTLFYTLSLGLNPSDVLVTDLNNDSRRDFIILWESSAVMTISEGIGGGQVGNHQFYNTGTNAESIALGDVNVDGRNDIVLANFSSETVTVYNNLFGLTFSAGTSWATGVPTASVALGDTDGEDNLDIVVTGQSFAAGFRSDLVKLNNNGSGGFAVRTTLSTQNGQSSVATADVDENGLADIITSQITPNPPAPATGGQLRVITNFMAPTVEAFSEGAECSGPNGASVCMIAVSSSPNGPITSVQWFKGATLLGTGDQICPTLSRGSHTITVRVTDNLGLTATDTLVAFVVDTTPPSISGSATPNRLYPPDSRMVPVVTTVTVSDACGGTTTVLTGVTSNQPDDLPGPGDGTTINDIQDWTPGTFDTSGSLRSEWNNGFTRAYEISYTATDGAGNSSSLIITVLVSPPTVPRNLKAGGASSLKQGGAKN